ncbi:Crp/Fnr family transcriptional regulator [Cohnella faecalis]|uniref:Crp/Fnr family transcriptional regulator n=1 Tax=Cohnella faecalis TaxID=2315694 RepID=A0A398CTN5_9BACL|nr:Crp/Fnr family transcriptional regulator [Cohnella faecalis]RIE02671.1 Crp/Fnr family transcriptional regulator [Cohnella faecalis]
MTEGQFREFKRKFGFAHSFDDDEWKHLGPVREWKKDDSPFPVEELEQRALIVLKGSLRLTHSHANGREWTVCRIREGGLFSLMASGIGRIGAEAAPFLKAEESTEALVLTSERLHRWIGKYDAFGVYVFDQIQELYAALSDRLSEMATRGLAERLCDFLEAGGWIARLSQEELAAELSTTREAVNRILKSWQRDELVEVSRKLIVVTNPLRLRQKIGAENE